MRFAHRYGPRTRWRDDAGHWHVRGRVERFLEPALLLLLDERYREWNARVEADGRVVPDIARI